jgi:hypothetical protein
VNPINLSNKELIDRIAKQLPKDIAAEYYREMMYCCSLPDNDEMLKILRILQILTALMDGIPSRSLRLRFFGLGSEFILMRVWCAVDARLVCV